MTLTTTIEDQIQLAEQHLQQGSIPAAFQLYSMILSGNPQHEPTLLRLGMMSYQYRQFQAAQMLLNKVLEVNPSNTLALFHLARINFDTHQVPLAVQHLEKLMALDPQNYVTYSTMLSAALDLALIQQKRNLASEYLFEHPPLMFNRLQIEVTTWCNLKCAGCPRTIDIEKNAWKNVHMPLERFQTLLQNLPPSNILCMQGVGESSLHPDFIDMVRFASELRKYSIITMNSNALAKPVDYYERLRDAGLGHISISVDSFDPVIAEACRSGTKTDKLLERLKQIYALFPGMAATIVVSKRNIQDVPNTLRVLNGIGAMEVELQALIVYDPDKGEFGNAPFALDASDRAFLKQLKHQSMIDFPNLTLLYLSPDEAMPEGNMRCSRPFRSPYVTAEGYLTPCCTCEDASVLGYANVSTTPLEEVWRSAPVQAWLRDYVKQPAAICNGCCFYTG